MDLLRSADAQDPVLACYAHDLNAVPAEWRLLPHGAWPNEFQGDRGEYELISRLHRLAELAGVGNRPEFWSITHREVAQALQSGTAPPLVYVRSITDLDSLDEPWNFSDAHSSKLLVPDGWLRQQQLIAEVRNCGHVIQEYAVARGDSTSWERYLETLCQQVITDATAAMQAAADGWASDPSRAMESKRVHEEFERDRRRVLLGRDHVVGLLLEPPGDAISRPIALVADSGVGKSAVLAQVASQAAHSVVVRYIGAAPGTLQLNELLADLSQAIPEALDVMPGAFVASGSSHEVLSNLLHLASQHRPLVLILDAVDRLESTEGAHAFDWLPSEVPPYAKVIISCARGVVAQRLRHAHPNLRIIDLGPIEHGVVPQVLHALLDQWGRTITVDQEHNLVEACQPTGLWLALAAEQVRGLASFEPLPRLPSSIDGLVNMVLTQWQHDHGVQLVARALGLLAVSRTGLTEEELDEALGSDPLVRAEFAVRTQQNWPDSENALPDVIWARLRADLDPYLALQMLAGLTVLRFFHQALTDIALERFANPVADADLTLHRILHRMFAQQARDLPAGPARDRAERERDWHDGRANPAGITEASLPQDLPLETLYARADDGDGEAMFWLATRQQDHQATRFWWSAAATAGFTPAMVNLGLLLEESDPTTAAAWYARAARSGDDTAQRNLQRLSATNLSENQVPGTLLDEAATAYAAGRIMQARKLWSQAAEQGSAEAHRCLGDVAQGQADMEGARRHWQMAADAGDVTALDRLAEDCLITGDGEGATRYAVRAASLDSVFAMRLLGDLAAGAGDSAAAMAWWRRASDRGDTEAQERLDDNVKR
jgi:TPR repeat protein